MKVERAALLLVVTLGLAYEAVLLFTSLLAPYRFPVPYAVPIFDTPFALVATGVGYLCLERHRLREDFQSAVVGVSLWLAALLAVAHILTQPDYPGTPGVDPGVAPYFFFASYLAALAGAALGIHYADHRLSLTDRARWMSVGVVVALALLIVLGVLVVRPLLPALVMRPGRLTPFAIWTAGIANGAVAVWALWGWRRRLSAPGSGHTVVNLLALAIFVWLLGMVGFLLFPYRYGVSWYLAGVTRPFGIGVIFVALLREQAWLYREARARLRDLEQLHQAGQALVSTLDASEILHAIATKGLTITQADSSILFRLDPQAELLHAVTCCGPASRGLESLRLRIGQGSGGLAALQERPVWTADVQAAPFPGLPADVSARLSAEGLTAILAVPLLAQGGEVLGSLWVLYREPRVFDEADVELLSAFGTQASAALENARAVDHLALKAMHDADLQDFAGRLLVATTEADILHDAVNMTERLLDADSVALFQSGPGGSLRLAAGLGWPPDNAGTDPVSTLTELFAGCPRLGKEPVELAKPPGIMVPMGVGEQPVGVLLACYHREQRRFTSEDRRVLVSLAYQIAAALDKVRLYSELQDNLARLQETQAQLMQADKLTALGTMLSGMAHELNNPLSTIRLSVEILKRTASMDAVLSQRVAVIDSACARASRIVTDLLMFARRKSPERQRVDLNEVIHSTLNLQAPQLELNEIGIVATLEPAPAIWGDSHQLQQVFLNLFSNAIDAMKTGHGHGTLTVRSVRRGSEITVEVEDDGPGIRPEHLGRIFDPFFTTKATGTGTGLGLSLSIGIVQAHGGHIQAESLRAGGARFTVHLPVGEGTEPEPPATPALPLPVATADVLIVEDEDPLRGLIAEAVRHLGHQVVEATTGQEALDRLQQRSYDVVMLDLRLPDVQGQAVWQQALAPDPQLAARVVFMTGDIMSAGTQSFLDETGRPFLQKPFTIEQVGRVVSEVLAAGS